MMSNDKLMNVLKQVNGYSGTQFHGILSMNDGIESLSIMDYRSILFINRNLESDLTLDKLKNDYNNNIVDLRKDFQLLSITYITNIVMDSIMRMIERNKWTMEMIYNKYKNGYKGNIMSLVSCKSELLSV